MPKFIFQLSGSTVNGPALRYFNVRGVAYKFFWVTKYRKHIFDARELDAREFNKMSEIFAGSDTLENSCHVVGRVLDPEPAVEPQAEVEVENELTMSERRQFLQTIADLEAKLKAKHGGRPRKETQKI